MGFVHRSRAIFCRAVPNLRVTIRDFFIAVRTTGAQSWNTSACDAAGWYTRSKTKVLRFVSTVCVNSMWFSALNSTAVPAPVCGASRRRRRRLNNGAAGVQAAEGGAWCGGERRTTFSPFLW